MDEERTAVKVAVWGMGRRYERLREPLLKFERSGCIEPVAITANQLPDTALVDGMPVVAPDELAGIDFDLLLITPAQGGEVRVQAAELGIDPVKTVDAGVFDLAGFDPHRYLQLRANQPSIVSNSVWGGLARKKLDLDILSPFEGTAFDDAAYLALLGNLKRYCGEVEPRFIEERFDARGDTYLWFMLDDIGVRFTRQTDPQQAVEDWRRGCMAMDWDNLFVQMSTVSRSIERAFCALPFERSVCMVPYETDEPRSLTVEVPDDLRVFYAAVNRTAYTGLPFELLTMM